MSEQDWIADLYEQYRRPLFLAAWNVVRCQGLAEDAVHSAFVRMAALPASPREPKLYAFRAVRNAALDAAKGRLRRREQPIVGDPPGPYFEILQNDNDSRTAITDALHELDAASREIIELHLHSNLTFLEISLVLDEPLQTVASRYRRALEKLRRMLEVCHE